LIYVYEIFLNDMQKSFSARQMTTVCHDELDAPKLLSCFNSEQITHRSLLDVITRCMNVECRTLCRTTSKNEIPCRTRTTIRFALFGTLVDQVQYFQWISCHSIDRHVKHRQSDCFSMESTFDFHESRKYHISSFSLNIVSVETSESYRRMNLTIVERNERILLFTRQVDWRSCRTRWIRLLFISLYVFIRANRCNSIFIWLTIQWMSSSLEWFTWIENKGKY
jgi:hypothetical protein